MDTSGMNDRDLLIHVLTTMQSIEEELVGLSRQIHGNGQPGIKDRTAKLETRVSYLQKLVFGIGGLATGGFITFVLNLIKT